MTDKDVLRALARKATPAWEEGDRWIYVPPEDPARNPTKALRDVFRSVPEAQDNVRFAVAAREAVPELLDRIDQLEATLALIREEAAKDNAPFGRSDSMALDNIRVALSQSEPA